MYVCTYCEDSRIKCQIDIQSISINSAVAMKGDVEVKSKERESWSNNSDDDEDRAKRHNVRLHALCVHIEEIDGTLYGQQCTLQAELSYY